MAEQLQTSEVPKQRVSARLGEAVCGFYSTARMRSVLIAGGTTLAIVLPSAGAGYDENGKGGGGDHQPPEKPGISCHLEGDPLNPGEGTQVGFTLNVAAKGGVHLTETYILNFGDRTGDKTLHYRATPPKPTEPPKHTYPVLTKDRTYTAVAHVTGVKKGRTYAAECSDRFLVESTYI